MTENVTIPVGGNHQSEYVAFGDDSQFGDALIFAFLIVHRSKLDNAGARLNNLKDLYRIPRQVPLHCRILFNSDARRKAGLSHLKHEDALAIVRKSVRIMNRTPMLLRYAQDSLSRFSGSFGNEIELTHHSDGSKIKLPFNPDPKGILGILMNACFTVPADGSGGPPASQCQIFVSEESTKVRFIGSGWKRADRMYSGYSDVGVPSGSVFQFQPIVLKSVSAPMLQLADVAAYMCSHAVGSSDETNFFREQLKLVEFWWRVVSGENPDPAAG